MAYPPAAVTNQTIVTWVHLPAKIEIGSLPRSTWNSMHSLFTSRTISTEISATGPKQ